MRTVVLYQLLSLDGVAEEPGDWFADDGPEMFENLGTVIGRRRRPARPRYLRLLGRLLADVRPRAVRLFINGTDKHVFTARPTGRGVAEHDVRHDLGRRSRGRDQGGRRR